MRRAFCQVDVFAPEAFRGNPVAVVLDGAGLDAGQMQQVANWTNLSETTFVLPPDAPEADYLVRIFTPAQELPFAGHPTLGTCHAWLEAGGTPRREGLIIQECAAGLVPIRQAPGELAFAAPPLQRAGPVEEALIGRIAAVLGIDRDAIIDAQWTDNGPGWVAVLLAGAQEVLALRPGITDLNIGVAGLHPAGSQPAVEVRAFVPNNGSTLEDPVTGSLNAGLAQWLLGAGLLTAPYVASQGTALGRRGRVRVERDDAGEIWVGGATRTCISGELEC